MINVTINTALSIEFGPLEMRISLTAAFLAFWLVTTNLYLSAALLGNSDTRNNLPLKSKLVASSKSNEENGNRNADILKSLQTAAFSSSFQLLSRFDEETSNLKSMKLFGLAFGLTALSLISFNVISQKIIAYSLSGSPAELLILDLRNGYTVNEVLELFKNWGTQGRLLYLLIELIDVCFYHVGYRTAFLILLNHLTTQVEKLTNIYSFRYFAAFPIILALIDTLEDVGQVILTATYNENIAANQWWQILVQVSSTINQTKWAFVQVGTVGFALLFIVFLIGNVVKNVHVKKE